MLVRWDCTVVSLALLNQTLVREVVAELVRAHRRGHHIVVINRAIVDWLLGIGGFSNSEISTLQGFKQNYTQTAKLYLQSKIYININSSICYEIVSNGSAIDVSLLAIKNSNIMDKPKLVVENALRDGWIYSFIIKNIKDKFGCRHVELDLSHGGGDDIVNVFSQMISEKRVVCSIVDSDNYSPLSRRNSKLNRLRTVMQRHNWPLAYAASPNCREIENLIPLAVINSIDSAKPIATGEFLLSIADMERLIGIPGGESFLLYIDFKEGITPETLIARDLEDRNWITDKILLAGIDLNDFEIKGYGIYVVDQIKRNAEIISMFRDHIRLNNWISVFGEFFEDIMWIFFSNRPFVT